MTDGFGAGSLLPIQLRDFFAVTAGVQEHEHVAGQILHAVLLRLGDESVGPAVVLKDRVDAEADAARGVDGARAKVAVGVVIDGGRSAWHVATWTNRGAVHQ